MFEGNDRTVMVNGIGNPSALTLLKEGYNVVLCAHSEEQAEAMSATIPENLRSHFMARYCLTNNAESVDECIRDIERTFGSLDVVINGAGALETARFDDTDYESFEKTVIGHLSGVFVVMKQAIPALLRGRSPRIINFTFIEGRCGKFNSGIASAVGKGGIVPLTRAVALDYAAQGLTANCIAVGAMETLRKRSDEEIDKLNRTIPLGRIATAADIAPAVCFLASEESRYITGAVLNVSGGAYMD